MELVFVWHRLAVFVDSRGVTCVTIGQMRLSRGSQGFERYSFALRARKRFWYIRIKVTHRGTNRNVLKHKSQNFFPWERNHLLLQSINCSLIREIKSSLVESKQLIRKIRRKTKEVAVSKEIRFDRI